MVYVSVDGGATKTVAACYDESGHILGVCAGGPSNFRNIGVDAARTNVAGCVEKAVSRAGVRLGEVEKMSFALAGVKDSAASTQMVEGFVKRLGFEKRYVLLNDGEAGFNCRFFGRDGVVVAAGTGMVAYIRSKGVFERASGWGWLIGDEGGGFYIGRRAIQEAAKIADGRSEGSEEFLVAVERFFGVSAPRRLVDAVYTNPVDIRRIGLLAREVSRLAAKGDPTALRLIEEAAEEAALNALALKRRFQTPSIPVSGFGGVFSAGPAYWGTIKRLVLERYPETAFLEPLYGYHAVLGSIYMMVAQDSQKSFCEEEILKEFDAKVAALPSDEKHEYLLFD